MFLLIVKFVVHGSKTEAYNCPLSVFYDKIPKSIRSGLRMADAQSPRCLPTETIGAR